MILRGLILALVVVGGWGAWRDRVAASWEAEALSHQKRATAYKLLADGCAQRIETITNDKETDHAVDEMDLHAVPDRWLRAE